MIEMWAAAPQDLQLLKVEILNATGLGKDALHIYTGLAIFIAVRLCWRWRGGWMLAWLVALAMASGVEWLDMRAIAGASPIQPDSAHWHDIWNTMFWPTVLLLVGRWLHPVVRPYSSDLADQAPDETGEQRPAV